MTQTDEAGEEVGERERVYRRELPGAGYVAIDVTRRAATDPGETSIPRIRVFVERRGSEERRIGHAPPVLVEMDGDDTMLDAGELYRMAEDNVAIARALLDWQVRRRRTVRAD